jgi:hypothetical protein
MRTLLSKHQPKSEPGEWEKSYNGAGWVLEPLAKAVLELAGDGVLKETDFKGQHAHDILIYRAGQRAAYLDVLSMLPPGARVDLPPFLLPASREEMLEESDPPRFLFKRMYDRLHSVFRK